MKKGHGHEGLPLMPKERFDLKYELGLAMAKLGSIAVIILIFAVSIAYCTHIYYDREQALLDALVCSFAQVRTHGVTMWITNGTLLGQQRLGRFVMWDGEIDIGLISTTALEPTIDRVSDACFGYSVAMSGGPPPHPRRWRLCTSRVCAEIHEFIEDESSGTVRSVDGIANVTFLLPTEACTMAGAEPPRVSFPPSNVHLNACLL
jgi:hypothetical protein